MNTPSPRRTALPLILGLLGVAAIYIAVPAFVVPPNGLWSGDQGAKLVQIFSLISNRFRSAALIYPAQELDPTGAFTPFPALYVVERGGAYYSVFSYPHAVLSALSFFALGYPGLYVVPVAATLTSALLLALLGRQLGIARWWLLVPVFGLATPLSFYALVLWEHALAVCLALGSTLCALHALERGSLRLALVAGLFGGAAYWMRAELLWFAPALLAGLLWARAGRTVLVASAAGLALPILLLMLVNTLWFGQPLGPQVGINYAPQTAADLIAQRGAIARVILLDPASRQLLPALVLVLCIGAALLPLETGTLRLQRAMSMSPLAGWLQAWLLSVAALLAIWILIDDVALHTGLAATCPLALAGLGVWHQRNPPVRLLLGAALVFAGGVLLTAPNDGGAQWGPRYLLVSTALLALLGLLAVQGSGRAQRLALSALLVAGLVSSLYGVLLLRESTQNSLRIVQVVNAQPSPVVLTDVWYGPQLLAPLYLERDLLYIDGPERLSELRALLQGAGFTEFSYVSAQPWERETSLPPETGLRCERVEGFAYGLTLLRCTILSA